VSTPRDILAVAVELAAGPTEAHWRSAISRAYYACHHALKAWHLALPVPGSVGTAAGSHAQLVAQLRNPARQCSSEQQKASRMHSVQLDSMLRLRVAADYLLAEPIAPDQAKTVCATAIDILGKL
jgi:uncharacterized protein (UPF0332 family)